MPRQELFTLLLKTLPVVAAEHLLRAVLSYVSSSIASLFVNEEGVPSYNMFSLYRLHADLRGLTRFAERYEKQLPGLEVRAPATAVLRCWMSPLHRELRENILSRRAPVLQMSQAQETDQGRAARMQG